MKYISAIRLQLFVLGFLSVLYLLVNLGYIPDEDELLISLDILFERYGLPILFALSLLENVVGLNVYFPGSIPLLYGMARTSGNPYEGIVTILVILIGSILGNSLNLIIGKRSKTSTQENNPIPITQFLITLWHPHLASLTSLQMGRSKDVFQVFIKKFIPILTLWYAIGGIFMYLVGYSLESSIGVLLYLFYFYLLIWILMDLYKANRKEEENINLT